MLEIKVLLHPASGGKPSELANMEITQVDRREGNLRDYHVKYWWQPMGGTRRLFKFADVEAHDRTEQVHALIRKAIEAIERIR